MYDYLVDQAQAKRERISAEIETWLEQQTVTEREKSAQPL